MAQTPRKKVLSTIQQTHQSSIIQIPPPSMQVNLTSPTTNKRGELLTWNSTSKDGILFGDLYSASQFNGKVTSHIKVKYNTQFGKYANKTLNSALQNLCQKDQRGNDTRQACGLYYALYVLAEDPDYIQAEDNLLDDVSMLSVRDDDFSCNTSFHSGIVGRSVVERDNRASNMTDTYCGCMHLYH
eukprot:8744790-Ditylum_brightwellii.AAC.1